MFPLASSRQNPVKVSTRQLVLEYLESRLNPSGSVAADQVSTLYRYVLGRDPDSSGLAAWTASLESGRTNLAQVADRIFHSGESIQYLVTQDYTRFLGRLPDPVGLRHFTTVMDGGRNANLVTASILGSAEFAEKSAQVDSLFVERLYSQLLGRPGDSEGVASHLSALGRGVSRTQVALSFLNSQEYAALQIQDAYLGLLGRLGSAPEIDGWVRVALQSSEGLLGVKARIAGSMEGAAWLRAPITEASTQNFPTPVFNIINSTAYDFVFMQGNEQLDQWEQPWPGFVLKPGESYQYASFETYTIDVRPEAGGPESSLGTALVESRIDSQNQPYLYDTNGLLSFIYSPTDTTNLAQAPYSITGQLAVMINPTEGGGASQPANSKSWGWTNKSPYDLKLTSISGDGASPPVGTIIPAGGKLGTIHGTNFEFDILVPVTGQVVGKSVVETRDEKGVVYLYDTKNHTKFDYNAKDSETAQWNPTWEDVTVTLAPPVISNNGWTSGMGNTESVATPGKSFWALDYGSENGRWTIQNGAAFQTTSPVKYEEEKYNFGSRAYPVTLDENFKASYGPGAGFDGLWQMDIKIGSSGGSDLAFTETFYLAERVNPAVGSEYYTDGSPNGGGTPEKPGPWSREIDIMETRWNGGTKQVGPQVNLQKGNEGKGPFTGWTTDNTYSSKVMGQWTDIYPHGAPGTEFATFGILIRGNSLWIYAYKPDGNLWYSTEEVVKNSDWVQKGQFVPYIGTWGPLENFAPGTPFSTGYKNFVYLSANDPAIAGRNPLNNPEAFGKALVHP